MGRKRLIEISKGFKAAGMRFAWILLFMCVVSAIPAHAVAVTIDQIIFQPPGDPNFLSGTLDITVTGASQLTVVLTNTSTAAGGTSSLGLLSGFGVQMGGINIVSGSAAITAGSTPVNFVLPFDLSTQWGFANSAQDGFSEAGVLTVNNVVSAHESAIDCVFSVSPACGPAPSIDGPDFGAIATGVDAGGQQAVRNSITFVLNLNGSANTALASILAGNVVLAFGSPTAHGGIIPEPSTYALYALGISMLLVSGWWQKRRKQQGGMAAI
jgi:hypothetical protein